jgi:large subunit ribosomal protein L24
MRIRKGDTVEVINGVEKGKQGKVLKVYPTLNRVIVEGVHKIKKHLKPSQANPDGGIREYEAPINASKVMLLDSKGNKTKVGYKTVTKTVKKQEVQVKVRFAKTTGEELE